MKRQLVVLVLVLSGLFGFSQNNSAWNGLQNEGLASAQFKIPVRPERARLLFGLTGQLNSKPQIPAGLFSWDQFGYLEYPVYNDPALWGQLYEQLGGEFWLGTLSQPGVFGPAAVTPLRSLGLQIVVPLGRFAAVQATGLQGSFTASASFPATIFDPHNGETRQDAGQTSIPVSLQQVQLTGRCYFFSPKALQLYAGAGGQFSRQTTGIPQAELQSVRWEYGAENTSASWQLLAQAGISVQPAGWPVFAELGVSAQKTLGAGTGKFTSVLQASVGWKW